MSIMRGQVTFEFRFRAFVEAWLLIREATLILDLRLFTRLFIWPWIHFLLGLARVWCSVGYKKASEYTSQASDELSVQVMLLLRR